MVSVLGMENTHNISRNIENTGVMGHMLHLYTHHLFDHSSLLERKQLEGFRNV